MFSAHSRAVIVVGELSQHFDASVGMLQCDVGVLEAIEHCGLHGGVVVHVLKCQSVAGLQGGGECPVSREIAAQA